MIAIDSHQIAHLGSPNSRQDDDVTVLQNLFDSSGIDFGSKAGVLVVNSLDDPKGLGTVKVPPHDIAVDERSILICRTHSPMQAKVLIEGSLHFESDMTSFLLNVLQESIARDAERIVALVTMRKAQGAAINLKATAHNNDNFEAQHPRESNVSHEFGKLCLLFNEFAGDVKDRNLVQVVRNVSSGSRNHVGEGEGFAFGVIVAFIVVGHEFNFGGVNNNNA
jgi:hypothetical protein